MKEVTYNEIEHLTGKPYRTIRKHFDLIGVEAIKRTGNKVFFRSTDALQLKSAELANADQDFARLLDQERHRKLQRENDIEDQIVAPVSILTEAIERLASQMIPILDSLPLEMKRRNPNLTGHDVTLVKKSVAKCRNAISEIRIMENDE